jgi:glycosyltransferase involved in cell wall biosynthesis
MPSNTLIIIPALNEEEALPAVLRSLADHAGEHDVLVVDDGSTDSTAKVAAAHGAFVARLPINLGIGAALRVGFRFAAERGYQRAVQFDADGQHEPTQVVRLLDGLDQGADFVIGSRFADGSGDYSVGMTRGTAMSMLRVMIRLVTRKPLTDTSSGFRGFSRPVIEYFSRNYPREYMDSVEAIVLASRAGFGIAEVPVTMHERAAGVPSNRRFRLAYNYIRVVLGIVLTMTRHPRLEQST